MNKLDLDSKTCIPSLKILGDFWTLRIIDSLSDGPLHYCEIQRVIDDVNTVTLTTRLKKLEKDKIINREEKTRADVTYSLTPLGNKILPVLDAINEFSAEAKTQKV